MFYLNPLAATDYIARLYGFRQRDERGYPSPAAFTLRLDEGEDFLSSTWMEYFHPNCKNDQVQDALAALRAKRTVGIEARLAVMNIGDVLQSCADADTLVEIKTTGEVDDPSHTGIYGYTHVNDEVAAILARRVKHQIHSARGHHIAE